MAPRKKTTPRKNPVQQRAVFTVDAILEAATYILVKDGWQKFTTNHVAERAGVNVASVYQYFPNKEAIVVELQRRHIDKARQGFPRVMPLLQSQRTLHAVLKMMIDAAVAEHRVAPALHRVFAEELPRSARPRDVSLRQEDIAAEWRLPIERFLKNVPNADLAMFLCRVVIHAAIHEAATERPELLDDPLFADEIVTLLENYLRRST